MAFTRQSRSGRTEARRPSRLVSGPSGKGAIHGLNQRGVRSDKSPRVTAKGPTFKEPTVCGRCGAVYFHKAWRRGRRIELLRHAAWDVCPACRQIERGEFYGQVVIRGLNISAEEQAILRRVANVAKRAAYTQPERKIVEIHRQGDSIEVRTTSQKLAHRIVHELQKAFGGRGRFEWSHGDGRLLATWDASASPSARSALSSRTGR